MTEEKRISLYDVTFVREKRSIVLRVVADGVEEAIEATRKYSSIDSTAQVRIFEVRRVGQVDILASDVLDDGCDGGADGAKADARVAAVTKLVQRATAQVAKTVELIEATANFAERVRQAERHSDERWARISAAIEECTAEMNKVSK